MAGAAGAVGLMLCLCCRWLMIGSGRRRRARCTARLAACSSRIADALRRTVGGTIALIRRALNRGDAGEWRQGEEQATLAETYFVVPPLALEAAFPGFGVGPSRGHNWVWCSWRGAALVGRAGCCAPYSVLRVDDESGKRTTGG